MHLMCSNGFHHGMNFTGIVRRQMRMKQDKFYFCKITSEPATRDLNSTLHYQYRSKLGAQK